MEMFIPKWHPASVNKLIKSHWQAMRLKKADREMIHGYVMAYKIPKAEGKSRVTLTIISPPSKRGRPRDPDSFWKSLLDALVQTKLLVDDSDKYVELMPVKYERSEEWGTRILLEAL